jgi:hypothetical protein
MSFLSLWALWFLVIVPVAIGLYLLRLKRKRHDVSSLIFWQQVLRDEQSTKLFQKLRRILSLLLQILCIVLIVLALARPILKRLMSEPTSRILVVDTTASMQVKEGDKTRFEQARAAARRWVGQSSFREETMILAAGREPKVVCPFSSDEKVLLEVLASLEPSDAGAGGRPKNSPGQDRRSRNRRAQRSAGPGSFQGGSRQGDATERGDVRNDARQRRHSPLFEQAVVSKSRYL